MNGRRPMVPCDHEMLWYESDDPNVTCSFCCCKICEWQWERVDGGPWVSKPPASFKPPKPKWAGPYKKKGAKVTVGKRWSK